MNHHAPAVLRYLAFTCLLLAEPQETLCDTQRPLRLPSGVQISYNNTLRKHGKALVLVPESWRRLGLEPPATEAGAYVLAILPPLGYYDLVDVSVRLEVHSGDSTCVTGASQRQTMKSTDNSLVLFRLVGDLHCRRCAREKNLRANILLESLEVQSSTTEDVQSSNVAEHQPSEGCQLMQGNKIGKLMGIEIEDSRWYALGFFESDCSAYGACDVVLSLSDSSGATIVSRTFPLVQPDSRVCYLLPVLDDRPLTVHVEAFPAGL